MRLVVARIARAHGVRGDVVLDVRTDDPQSRLAAGTVLQTTPAAAGPLTVDDVRQHSGRLLARFVGVDDRGRAEALRGVLLETDVDPAVRPDDPDEYYDHQLVGLDVVDVAGTTLGQVAEVIHLPGQDLIAVHRPDGGETLVPFVAALVPSVDLDSGRVVVDPPGGLFETDGA